MNWRCCGFLLLLAAATAVRAGELPVSEKSSANQQVFSAAMQERPKLERRDLLVFFREDLNYRNHSNSWFMVRADFREIASYDSFTRREEPYVAGIKACFTF